MSQLNKILSNIGEFGPFQRRVYALLNFLTVLRCCQMYLLVFVADKPQWDCLADGGHFNNNRTKQHSPCLLNGSSCESVRFSDEFTSISSEWRLICDQEYKRSLANAIVMAGCFIGALMFGGIADKRGRKSTIIMMYFVASISCFASGFAPNYEVFVLLRFFTAVMINGSSTAIFVLVSEIVGQTSKDMLLTAYQAFYAIGYVVLSVSAYYIRDWRYLTIIISSPIVFSSVFLLQSGLCESPQWLIANGRIDEGKKLLKEIAKKNGGEISEKALEKLANDVPKTNPKNTRSNINTSLFSKPGNVKKVLTLSVVWLFLAMMYNGLSFLSGSLSANKYLSFSLCGLVEIPALLLSMWVIKWGRRTPLFSLAMVGSLACLLCAWLQGGEQSRFDFLIIALALLGKFGVAASYNIIYIFSAEHFGVAVRGFSISIFQTASSVGGILAPLVIGLETYDKRIPMFSFGLGAVCAAGFVLTLPETLRRDKPLKKTQ